VFDWQFFAMCSSMFGLKVAVLVVPFWCDAARTRANTTRGVGRISHMYTFGAPHPSNPMLTTKNGGCFSGYRITNGDDDWFLDDEDIVPTLLVASKYDQPNVQTLVVVPNGNGIYANWACGDNPTRVTRPSIILHDSGRYQNNMNGLSSSYSRAKEASAVGLKNSYLSDVSTIKRNVGREGWNSVGMAHNKEDVSLLMQEPRSKRCILTFEGSDTWRDFITDAAVRRVKFCGLPFWVHTGFRNELRRMVQSSEWQSEVRPKLGKCSSVDVVGHSLGGATATLFAACVDWQNGSDDYNDMSWKTGRATVMRSL